MNITKSDLSSEVSKNLKITRIRSKKFLESFLKFVKKYSKNSKLKLSGFGTFELKNTPERIGRNPATLKKYKIKATKKITFKSSSIVKSRIN